mmetsp:Transcript_42894/g.136315  ORF Transcript_42894/g.136315 Transcript_42894/m.136315 type:complete len:427 (-) Transcript_42894:105-1385(-)
MRLTRLCTLIAASFAGPSALPQQPLGGQEELESSLDLSLAVDDECLARGGCEECQRQSCSLSALQRNVHRVRGPGGRGTSQPRGPPSVLAQLERRPCPAEASTCPAGLYLCTAGPAVGGCFTVPSAVSPQDCTAFATVPCSGTSLPSATTVMPPPQVVHPTAAPAQATRLRITNGCTSEPMWIASMAGTGRVNDPSIVELAPLAFHDFHITDGLASTRYWPKLGCDLNGGACRIGDSGGPGQVCNPQFGCAPPVDSKFEATFGAVGQPCDFSTGQIAGCDWLDISMVDGFTVPFRVEVLGDCHGSPSIDCSALSFSRCPSDLQVRHPGTGDLAGCYSPCAKRTTANWGNAAGRHSPADPAAMMYCCPTPPITPSECQAGPVAHSPYVAMVHSDCPGVYAYAYDDAEGLRACPAGVQYHVTFYCPAE